MSSLSLALEPSFFHGAAFWVAWTLFPVDSRLRFMIGLTLGALLTRVAWAGLHFSLWLEAPWSLMDRSGGFSVLALPVGLLLVAPYLSAPGGGQAYRAAAARAVVPALAVARLGCVWWGCCGGRVSALGLAHPVAVYEVIFWFGLGLLLRRIPDSQAPGLWLVAFGAIRLGLEPLRSAPPLGPPEVDVSVLAGIWLGLGLLTLYFDRRVCGASGLEIEAFGPPDRQEPEGR